MVCGITDGGPVVVTGKVVVAAVVADPLWALLSADGHDRHDQPKAHERGQDYKCRP